MRAAVLAFCLAGGIASAMPFPLKDTGGTQFVSSPFGIRRAWGGQESEFHQGIDIACRVGTPVLAVGDGEVIVCALDATVYGRYMILRLDSGVCVLYGHLSESWIPRGKRVSQGQVIGLSGNTGKSTGPHLHFAIMVDPQLAFGMGNPAPWRW